jgi:hypothetical protein
MVRLTSSPKSKTLDIFIYVDLCGYTNCKYFYNYKKEKNIRYTLIISIISIFQLFQLFHSFDFEYFRNTLLIIICNVLKILKPNPKYF